MADADAGVRVHGHGRAWTDYAADLFIWVEHAAYAALGVLLCVTALVALAGAAVQLFQGMADWTGTKAIFSIIDRLLFVLMLIEIMHTVRASLSSGSLSCEPFLVVGLIASVRRVLVITLETSDSTRSLNGSPVSEQVFRASMIELAVLGMLILVMVMSIYVLHQTRKRVDVGK
jgi:uncharacterized membrane protein (DUF373 family)